MNLNKLFEIGYLSLWLSSFGDILVLFIFAAVIGLIIFLYRKEADMSYDTARKWVFLLLGLVGMLGLYMNTQGSLNSRYNVGHLAKDEAQYKSRLAMQDHLNYQITHTKNHWEQSQYRRLAKYNANLVADSQYDLKSDLNDNN